LPINHRPGDFLSQKLAVSLSQQTLSQVMDNFTPVAPAAASIITCQTVVVVHP